MQMFSQELSNEKQWLFYDTLHSTPHFWELFELTICNTANYNFFDYMKRFLDMHDYNEAILSIKIEIVKANK